MAYILDGVNIKRPNTFEESNDTQLAQNRTLDGSITRDHFGDNKRTWKLQYRNVNNTDYNTINTIYQAYLSDEMTKSWQVTETNYAVSSTSVHIDLKERGFSIKGTDYLSDFDLILTET